MKAMRNFRVAAALTLLSLVTPLARPAELPRPAPDLAINLTQGKQLKLSQFKGKTVVLAFILTYCSHCQSVMAALAKMHNEYGARGLQVVASATEDMAASALPAFLRQFVPPFPVGYNTNIQSAAFLQHPPMLMFYMPAVVFIDKDGMIRQQYEGRDSFLEENSAERNIRAEIEKMLVPPARKKPAGKKTAKTSAPK
jgi:peroxiredoxin